MMAHYKPSPWSNLYISSPTLAPKGVVGKNKDAGSVSGKGGDFAYTNPIRQASPKHRSNLISGARRFPDRPVSGEQAIQLLGYWLAVIA